MSENILKNSLIDLCKGKLVNEDIYAKGMYIRNLIIYFS